MKKKLIYFLCVAFLNSYAAIQDDLVTLKNVLIDLHKQLSSRAPVITPIKKPKKPTGSSEEMRARALLTNTRDILQDHLVSSIRLPDEYLEDAMKELGKLFNLSRELQEKLNLRRKIAELYRLIDQLEEKKLFNVRYDLRVQEIIHALDKFKIQVFDRFNLDHPINEKEISALNRGIIRLRSNFAWNNPAQSEYVFEYVDEINTLIYEYNEAQEGLRAQQPTGPVAQPSEKEEELECPICLEEIKKGAKYSTTGCNKVICKTCWKTLKKGSSQNNIVCPFCRAAESKTRQYKKQD